MFSRPVMLPWKPPDKPTGQELLLLGAMVPESGTSAPPSSRTRVDLPAPFRPIRPMFFSGIFSDRSRKTWRRPLGVRYDLVIFLSSNTVSLRLAVLGGDQMQSTNPVCAERYEQQNQGDSDYVIKRDAIDGHVIREDLCADQFQQVQERVEQKKWQLCVR